VHWLILIVYPEKHLPTPGQHGHSPQRHTAAGTAAPTTADMGSTVPQRANTPLKRPMLTPGRVHLNRLTSAQTFNPDGGFSGFEPDMLWEITSNLLARYCEIVTAGHEQVSQALA